MDRVGKQAGEVREGGKGGALGSAGKGCLRSRDEAYASSYEPAPGRDEQAVLDHVTGLTPILPRPESGQPATEDRLIVGELVAMRSMLQGMAITPPPLRLKFDDVLKAAGRKPAATRENRIIYWLTGHWGLGFVTAASVALAVISGWAATSKSNAAPAAQTPVAALPHDEPAPTAKQAWISLRHDHPSDVQARVTALVTMLGGTVTFLTRQERRDADDAEDAPDAGFSMQVVVPVEKYQLLTRQVTEFGTLEGLREHTADLATPPPGSLATLHLEVSPAQADAESWEEAADRGLRGLEHNGKQLLAAGIAGSPALGLGALACFGLTRLRRRKAA